MSDGIRVRVLQGERSYDVGFEVLPEHIEANPDLPEIMGQAVTKVINRLNKGELSQ